MAITKLLKIKSSSSGKASKGLASCLKYIANPEKTDDLLLTGGSSGGDPELTYSDMLANKRSWGKTDGTQGYHYILSLPPDEHPDAQTMRNLTEDFCKELLQDRYLFSYAIHTDRNHMHSHVVFDSVSHVDGRMWKSGRYDWLSRIQPIADKLCKKYGLRSLDFKPEEQRERQNKYHNEWEAEQNSIFKFHKDVTWNDIIRSDIDSVLHQSHSWQEFLENLQVKQYDVKDGMHLSLRPAEKERYVRTARLGMSYTKEQLLKRLGEQKRPERPFGDGEMLLNTLRRYLQRTEQTELTGIKVIYLQRWYAYSYVNRSKTPYKYRKELVELGKYTDRCAYLFKHDIATTDDIQKHLQGLQEKQSLIKKELSRTQNQIYNTPLSAWRKIDKLRSQLETASEVERPKLQEQISTIIQPLKGRDMMADAEKYRALQEKKSDLQTQSKKLTAEIKMASDLIADFEKTKSPDDIMKDPDRYIPSSFTDKSYQRITVNKVLFMESPDDSDYLKIKIPGSLGRHILLYKADTKMAQDGSFASCYLYDHLPYKVVNSDNSYIQNISGSEAMKLFTDRTRDRRR